ncbi:MAG TPA: DUF6174 domain-containing protein [Gemmatimonadaceae bacterium]|nr:DUF6174 domain-containing protein [Gemmatimonadaceae bacterium]
MQRKLSVLLGALVLAACDSPIESLDQQRLWSALEIRNYDFVYTVACFCAMTGPNPAKITVRNGLVVKAEPTSGAVIPPVTTLPGRYPTVDSLFAIIERARQANPAKLEVQYDETYHFPKVISLDPVEKAVDDEISYRVDSFVPNPPSLQSTTGGK